MTTSELYVLSGVVFYAGMSGLCARLLVKQQALKYPSAGWDEYDTMAAVYFSVLWPIMLPVVAFTWPRRPSHIVRKNLFHRWFEADVKKGTAVTTHNPAVRVDLLPETRQFLREWYKWATVDGAPQGQPYNRRDGLCRNALFRSKVTTQSWKLLDDLNDHFIGTFPFGKESYFKRQRRATMHKCPKRLEWALTNGAPD